jgi:hypothetical protein
MKESNKKEQISPNNQKKDKQRFDSETYGNSKKNVYLEQENDKMEDKIYKKSIDFFPKKMNIEELDEKEYKQRKYTLEKNVKIKNFVPQIKPIKIFMIPSKLRLNKKGFKDLKRNQNNKILLKTKKYYISCPNLEEEESEKNNSSKELNNLCGKFSGNINNEMHNSNKNGNIEFIRKEFQNIKKKNIPKIKSKKNAIFKNKYEKDLNLGCSSDSDLYDIDELNNYSFTENKGEKSDEDFDLEEEKKKGRNRFYSWSILDVLKNNIN